MYFFLVVIHLCKFCCLVSCDTSINDILDVSVHDLVEFIECKTDTVICYSSLWEVLSTNLFRTVTCTNLAMAHLCFRIMSLLLL